MLVGCQCGSVGHLAALSEGWVESWSPQALPLATWAWRRSWPTVLSPCSLKAPKGQEPRSSTQLWAGRHARVSQQPWGAQGQRILWVLGIHTRLAADLIVAVAARVQPGGEAALIPGHLDWVFLEPPDQALHQTKLDQPPGDEEERDWDHNAEVPNAPAPHIPFCSTSSTTASRFLPYGRRVEYFLLTVSATLPPRPSGTNQEGSDLSSTLWSCRV